MVYLWWKMMKDFYRVDHIKKTVCEIATRRRFKFAQIVATLFIKERIALAYFYLSRFCHQIISKFANTLAPKLNKKDPIVFSISSPPILLDFGSDNEIIS